MLSNKSFEEKRHYIFERYNCKSVIRKFFLKQMLVKFNVHIKVENPGSVSGSRNVLRSKKVGPLAEAEARKSWCSVGSGKQVFNSNIPKSYSRAGKVISVEKCPLRIHQCCIET